MTQHESLHEAVSSPESGAEPRGAMEIVVAEVVAKTLGAPSVPRAESFFELGANSVAVARICAQLEQATGTKVQISQIFRTPTVAGLAQWLRARAGSPPQPAAAAQPPQGGLVALTPMQAAGVGMNIVSQAIWWLDGPVDATALEQAATDIHRRHQGLHARYVVSGPAVGYAMVPADPGRPNFSLLPAARTDAAAVDAVRAALPLPLRIEDGEVWRCLLAPSAESGRSLFAFGVDHTAFDARSASIVAKEFSVAYAARMAGKAPDFGAPVASLAEIGAEYAAQLASTDLDAQREYWRSEFRGVQRCYFPGRSSAVRPPGTGPVAEPVFTLEPAQLAPWHAYGRGRGMTSFVWLVAAYTQTLIGAGAPQDLGFMFGIANRGSDLIDRSVTCRVVFAFLRPNGPARNGGNLLARTHDAYNKAMANMEGRIGHDEISGAVGLPPDEFPILQALPHVIDADGSAAIIRLGGATGTVAPEFTEWKTGPADLSTQIVHGPPDMPVEIKVAVRTDAYPADLADQICQLFVETIKDGPERLEQKTAS